MNSLILNRSDLVERLQQVAIEEATSAEELLDRAVAEFLENVALQKLKDETLAFEQMHSQLVQQYLGEYVAVHNGAVVDHDVDARSLHLRIRARFGQMPILLRQITEDVELPELIVRSPKLVAVSL
jgi:hypothetical protein